MKPASPSNGLLHVLALLAIPFLSFLLAKWVAGLAPLNLPIYEAVAVAGQRAGAIMWSLSGMVFGLLLGQVLVVVALVGFQRFLCSAPTPPFDPALPVWNRRLHGWWAAFAGNA